MFGFQNAQAVNEWTKVQVIVEAVAAVGIILTLLYSLWSFTRSLRAGYYTELDRMYFDLLKIAMDRPYLLNFAASPNDQQQREYEIYAFMIWNFLETVFDRCHKHKHLRDTWYPIISAENTLHRKWFDERANRTRFKQAFIAFIESRYPNPR
ncbi:MAG TPA: hypothetical protein VG649_18455 [Candidatus Angelobacter sp.]|jgi:hypothetical protein|nr:hypothetical protein [Candidatus Angelobacter sp.]